MKLKYEDPMMNINMFADENTVTTNSSITAEKAAEQNIGGKITEAFGSSDNVASDYIKWNW